MKGKLLLAMLVVCGGIVGWAAAVNAGIIVVDSYLVGDKDDFNNFDGDGIPNMAPGDAPRLPYSTMTTPDAGNTDYLMYPQTGKVFNFHFDVASHPGWDLLGGVLKVVTWDNNGAGPDWNGNYPGWWGSQPITVNVGSDQLVLDTCLAVDPVTRAVQHDEIALSPEVLALLAGGGGVDIVIGNGKVIPCWDVTIIDYAELLLTYDDPPVGGLQDEVAVPETSSALLALMGIAGLASRKTRRS